MPLYSYTNWLQNVLYPQNAQISIQQNLVRFFLLFSIFLPKSKGRYFEEQK